MTRNRLAKRVGRLALFMEVKERTGEKYTCYFLMKDFLLLFSPIKSSRIPMNPSGFFSDALVCSSTEVAGDAGAVTLETEVGVGAVTEAGTRAGAT